MVKSVCDASGKARNIAFAPCGRAVIASSFSFEGFVCLASLQKTEESYEKLLLGFFHSERLNVCNLRINCIC